MSKLSLSGKIPDRTPITLSTHQTMLVEKFIAERGALSLASIDAVILSTQHRLTFLSEKLDIYTRTIGECVDIVVINECKRIAAEKRNHVQEQLALIDTGKRASENMTVYQYLTDEITQVQAQLSEWAQIRQIFVDIYPESKTSPRLSRSDLEKSPSRFTLPKSLSQPALPSPRQTPRKLKEISND